MPTVLRQCPYRFFWYSHEASEPAHVHIDRDQCSAKFWLEPVGLARNMGFKGPELKRIRIIIENNRRFLLEAWYGYFGT
ncbi:MAG: DUF4160 domain-containing protein [Xanthomonadales bacterium]|nr:DUF4160 domain-containing protein [Xanthomonadales bacterium]